MNEIYGYLLQAHSILRWFVLLFLLIVIFRHATAGNRTFRAGDRTAGTWLIIAADLMFIIGVYQWVVGPFGLKAIQNNGMSVVMKDPVARFFAVEHFAGMLIAIILIHIGRSYIRKNMPDRVRHRRSLIFYALALLLILLSIPWPFREGLGRPWIRLESL